MKNALVVKHINRIEDGENPYKLPLSSYLQLEIVGELRSAKVRIQRLEECREELTLIVQELIAELRLKGIR